MEFVGKGEFGLASGQNPDGTYGRVWFFEPIGPEEVSFDSGVFLLTKAQAKAFKATPEPGPMPGSEPQPVPQPEPEPQPKPEPVPEPTPEKRTIRVSGNIPPELWNRLGTKLIPKLRCGEDLNIEVIFSTTVDSGSSANLGSDLRQAIKDLGLEEKIKIE